ncbi:hypothetical protein R1sor_002480 [Riccia sorocarpa]|uniref:Reverse transcriptase zinc-binding domain-containing protein n=1 Tax=Riccia sorocarpa TaxID=122646 RepID=A0ABD3GZS6_9MARC
MAFLLGTNLTCFQHLISLLARFTEVAGCRVNWRKTWYLAAGKYNPPFLWMQALPFQLLHRTQGVHYLGVMILDLFYLSFEKVSSHRYLVLSELLQDVLDTFVITLHDGDRLEGFSELSDWAFTAGSWELDFAQWQIITPISKKAGVFPFKVSILHRVVSEAQTPSCLLPLISQWELDWTVLQWTQVCKSLCRSGIHRRDLLFLWRLLARAFFTGSKAAQMRVAEGLCPYCSLEVETV